MLSRNINLLLLLLISTVGFGQRISSIRKPLAPYTGYYRDTVLSIRPTHILSYYPMDESSGTVCTDVKHGRNGIYINGVSLGKSGIGDGLKSVQLDGTNDYIDIGNSTNSTTFDGKQGALSFWVKIDTSKIHPTSTGYIMNLVSNTAGNQITILKDPSSLNIITVYQANSAQITYVYPINSEWMHIGLIWDYDNSQYRAFFNGEMPYLYSAYPGDIKVWSGSLNTSKMVLGCVDQSVSTPIKAQFAHFVYWDTTITTGDMRRLSSLHRHDNTVHPYFAIDSMFTVVRGDRYSSTGDHHQRPNLCDLFGRWCMIYKRASYHNIGDNTSLTHLRFSDDEGATWSKEDTLPDGITKVIGMPSSYHGANQNKAGGIMYTTPNGDVIIHEYESGSSSKGTYQYRSHDVGETWTDEGRVLNDPNIVGEEDYTIVNDTIYEIFRDITINGAEKTVVYRSIDDATTWTRFSVVDSIGDPNEAGIEYTGPGGRMVVVSRATLNDYTAMYISNNYGRTWGPRIYITDQVGIVHKPMLRMFGSNLVMVGRDYINNTAYYNAAWISKDNGATWSQKIRLDPGDYQDGAYMDVLQRFTGELVAVGYRGIPTQSDLFKVIFHIK